jgi:mono/diheme cytochrome c family protein
MRFAQHTKTLAIVAALPVLLQACSQPTPAPPAATAAAPSPAERGKYLVTVVGGCEDCHSPKLLGPQGPTIDPTRRLSGHPVADKLPPTPAGAIAPDKFGAVTTNDFTAWVGLWGTSYTANLTPDKATGLGSWTEDMFIKTLRTGKHQGEGRPILPPMPWQNFSQMTDADLKAVWAYLQTLPPIQNPVPDPVPPAGAPAAPGQ